MEQVLHISRMTSARRMKTAKEVIWKLGIITPPKEPRMRHVIKAVQILNADVTVVLHSCLEIAEEDEEQKDTQQKQRVIIDFSDLDPVVSLLLNGVDERIMIFDSLGEKEQVKAPDWFNRLSNEIVSRHLDVEDKVKKGM